MAGAYCVQNNLTQFFIFETRVIPQSIKIFNFRIMDTHFVSLRTGCISNIMVPCVVGHLFSPQSRFCCNDPANKNIIVKCSLGVLGHVNNLRQLLCWKSIQDPWKVFGIIFSPEFFLRNIIFTVGIPVEITKRSHAKKRVGNIYYLLSGLRVANRSNGPFLSGHIFSTRIWQRTLILQSLHYCFWSQTYTEAGRICCTCIKHCSLLQR